MLYVSVFIVVFFFYRATYGTDAAHSKGALATLLILLCLIVGFGDMLGGYDRYLYGSAFDQAADVINKGRSAMTNETTLYSGYQSEMAFVFWNVIVAHVTENRYIFILYTTIFMYILLYKSLKDYIDDNYFFAVMVFMGLWFFFTFTYLRQAMATCVAWYSYRYIIKRKPIQFFICAFIAYKFHNSAIVFMPLYFIPLKKWSQKQIVWLMVIMFIIGLTGAGGAIYTLYGSVNDERNSAYEQFDTGGRWIFILEIFLFLYFIFERYDEIQTEKDLVFLNASLCFCIMLLFFFRNSNAGRQSWYFMMGLIYLFTKLATHNKGRIDGYNELLLLLVFGLFLRIAVVWGYQINPYKTFLTNGYRPNDEIIFKFEYDWNYETNKMYRRPFRIVKGAWLPGK